MNSLDVNIIPQGGTAIAEAIETARVAFKEKNDNHKVLVLFTDGEDHDGQAVEVARKAAKDGIRIFTVGVGTANGELLRINDGKGRMDYIRDEQQNVVKSRLNEKLLQDIANAAEGFYMLLSGANTIDVLYERGLAPLPKSEFAARHVKRYHERYQWFLGAAILALLTEMFLPERKKVRRSRAIVAAGTNAELRQAVAAAFVFSLSLAAFGSSSDALKAYSRGKYESARREYEELLRNKPDDARLHFNAGTAAFQAKDYEKAVQHLNSALVTQDLQLQERAYYNRGNAHFRLGEETSDPKGKMGEWEEAVGSYESALKLNPQDADAKHNLDIVQRKLEELKKQQQQQQSDQSKDDKNKKDEQKDQQSKQDQRQKQDQSQQQKQDQQQSQKPDQQKQQQQKDEQKQQDQSKPQDQQQAQKPDDKKADENKPQPQPGQKDDKNNDPQQATQAMRAMQMTPQQAQQLLDAQKAEERAMIFIPQMRTNRQNRAFKDW